MKPLMVAIDKVKADPNQPRKIFDEGHIKGLAISLTQEGLINPIEVDANYQIITGECRWRAAKSLGWKEVPCLINDKPYSEYERLRHQMAENVHQSGSTYDTMMNPIDTANGYAKLYELKYNKKYKPGLHIFKSEGRGHKGPFELIAEEIGLEKQTIWEHLKLLEQPEFVQESIKEGTPRTYYREADRAPEEVKDKIKEKIAEGHYKSREDIIHDVTLAKKTPDLAVIELERNKAKSHVMSNKILTHVAKLGLALRDLPLNEVDIRERGIIEKQLLWIREKIDEYLS